MINIFRKTPSQAAGLIADTTTVGDQRLWEKFKQSEQARQIVDADAAAQLSRRRELVACANAERVRLADGAIIINRAKDNAAARVKTAELELHAAVVASRSLPMWAPEDSPALNDAIGELRRTADSQITELCEWLSNESEITRSYSGPTTLEPGFNPFGKLRDLPVPDPKVNAALAARQRAISIALFQARDLVFKALSTSELDEAIQAILASVPAIPADASQVSVGPTPLVLNGKVPNSDQVAHATRMAALSATHAHITAATKPGSRR